MTGEPRRAAALVAMAALAAVAWTPGPALSQGHLPGETREVPVTLERALEEAKRANPALRLAGERREMAEAGSRLASSRLLPRLDLESGWLRSGDPVAVFGTKLRQGTFGPSDLAIDALNDPAPADDWRTALRLSWAGASPQVWAARSAAGHRAAAAELEAVRVRQATAYRTRVLYFEAVREEARVEAAGAAREAASATVDRFRRRHEEGLATRADLLQARAELSAARAELLDARRRREDARLRLGLHLGWGADSLPAPTDSLASPRPLPEAPLDPTGRPDLRARHQALEAAEAEEARAKMGYLPRLEAFADYSLHDAEPFGSSGTDWSVGVGLRWNLFGGFGRSARVQRSSAGVQAARIEHRQAVREARVEVRQARRAVAATERAVEATAAAREASLEGRELMRRRFEEGLATPSDLLEAEARAVRMRARAIDALADYHVARAGLRLALGHEIGEASAGADGGGPTSERRGR